MGTNKFSHFFPFFFFATLKWLWQGKTCSTGTLSQTFPNDSPLPWPSNPCLDKKNNKGNHQRSKGFSLRRTPKILGKGRNKLLQTLKKQGRSQKKGNPKKEGLDRQGGHMGFHVPIILELRCWAVDIFSLTRKSWRSIVLTYKLHRSQLNMAASDSTIVMPIAIVEMPWKST